MASVSAVASQPKSLFLIIAIYYTALLKLTSTYQPHTHIYVNIYMMGWLSVNNLQDHFPQKFVSTKEGRGMAVQTFLPFSGDQYLDLIKDKPLIFPKTQVLWVLRIKRYRTLPKIMLYLFHVLSFKDKLVETLG